MKFKKSLLIICLIICIFAVASVSATDVNDTAIASEDTDQMELSTDDGITEDNLQANNEETVSAETDSEILTDGQYTYSNLREQIGSGGNINLTKGTYTYNNDGDTIEISTSGVINGNGAIIDMTGSTIRAFTVSASGVTIKNLTIKNANYDGDGGAIYFSSSATSGTVTNCNFVDNKATESNSMGGAVYFNREGAVTNCNFADNKATGEYSEGGAVYFLNPGNVTNCNFINNKATGTVSWGGAVFFNREGNVTNCNFTDNIANNDGGAVYFNSNGEVTNCNFADNKATGMGSWGGAVYFAENGNVTNCNFVDNSASEGGAIFSVKWYTAADTCIFKRNSGDNFNTVIYPPTLNVDNFTTVYGSGEKLTFDLKTNSSIPVTNGNILISVYFKDNGVWVRNYTCLSGEGWIPDLPVGSYIAFFDTEYAEFQKINRTITITAPEHTFWFLNYTINGNDNPVIELSHDFYFDSTYDSAFTAGIDINRPVTINGNGRTIDAKGQARILWVRADNVNITNITFVNGKCDSHGGAIYWYGDNGTVSGSSFTGNNANDLGGAICWFGANGTVFGSSFTGNNANWKGGAIYWFGDNGAVSGSCFTGNNATDDGGAIYWHGANGAVSGSCFTGNNATEDGDAIFGLDVEADYCWFGGNATNYMDALPINPGVKWAYILFLNATANPNEVPAFSTSEIVFKLYLYNKTSTAGNISEYDNTRLLPINLTITSTNGDVDIHTVNLGESIRYTATSRGTGSITASIENVKYTIETTNLGLNPDLSVDSQEADYSNRTIITINYNSSATGTVNITLKGKNGNNYTFTNFALNATILLPEAINADEYDVNVTYSGDNVFLNATANATLTVNKLKTELTASAVTTTYNINKDLVITLKDSTGKVLSGFKVTVDLNGAKTYITDSNGQVKVSTKGLAPKAYTAKVTFNGNTNYAESSKDVKVTVKKATPKLTAKKKTFKTSVKTKKYTVTLKDNTGKAIKKAKVTLKVKGKTYKATTNSKGKAVFKIKNLKKKGKYTAVIKFKGNKYYNKATKKAKIKVIVTFKTVSKGSKDKSTVKEIQQALKNNGYYLTYDGHYLKIDGIYHGCTERSVREFQHDKGLKVTGKVDEKTAKKLGII